MFRGSTSGTLSRPMAGLTGQWPLSGTFPLLPVLVLLLLCRHASAARILIDDSNPVTEQKDSVLTLIMESYDGGAADVFKTQKVDGKKRGPVDIGNQEDFPSLGTYEEDFPTLDTTFGINQAFKLPALQVPRQNANKVKKWDANELKRRLQRYIKPVAQTRSDKRSSVDILTWNARDVVDAELADVKEHAKYVRDALASLVQDNKPSVLVLQEVQACSLIESAVPDFTCVDSVVDAKVEAQLPRMALGNVLFYETKLFEASNPNRILQGLKPKKSPYTQAASYKHGGDKKNSNLYSFHRKECTWSGYNGCHNLWPDAPRVTTVKLTPKCAGGLWSEAVCNEFKHGLRIVGVHLFAGGKWIQKKVLTGEQVLQRRRFQMRALFHLIDHWNYVDHHSGDEPPSSVYVGDFNTPKASDLLEVLGAAKDYGLNLFCPMVKGYCKTLASDSLPPELKSHPKGHLDHVVMDMRLQSQSFPTATSKVIKQPSLSDKLRRQKYPGCKSMNSCQSDHSPMLVQLLMETT